MMNKRIVFVFLLFSIFSLLLGCTQSTVQEDEQYLEVNPSGQEQSTEKLSTEWMSIGLVDVRTRQTFKISDFKGKSVLLESFAVWCPICTQQQKKIKELHEELGDAFVSISLDTDPNEDATVVKEEAEERGFDWYFAVSPVELTQALIDQFGVSVVDAPAAPVILVCKDGSARLLGRGIKSARDLKGEITKGC